MGKMSKLENQNSMKAALADASLSDNSVDLILKAINDMQDKINAETEKKLGNFVRLPEFKDLEGIVQAVNRRIGHNEGLIKELQAKDEQFDGLIDANKKRIARLQTEVDALKYGQRLGSAMSASVAEEPIVLSSKEEGGAVSGEGLEKLQRLIQRVEGSLIRRISSVETIIGRVDGLDDEMGVMKSDIARALKPHDPFITREDVDRWDAGCKKIGELEDALHKLRILCEDVPIIKADVLQILKIQNTFVTKDCLDPLID
mmetsp:Transcript_31761/g.39513  ORF Transcript_31761/g.39513 Transcript_31761/m.39513 type:complete len:259 (-) Transcript_31761:226-1002(-)